MTILTAPNWTPQSESDKENVLRQMEKLFAHSTFRSSRRCPAFLQYIVEHQLKGDTQNIKERIIGAEVFGRELDYDTSADPVVRTTASEVRKRIAQYYQEPGHEGELRIELPLGSYAVEFHLPPAEIHPPQVTQIAPLETPSATAQAASNAARTKWLRPAILGLAVMIAVAGLVAWRVHSKQAGIDDFWRPMLTSPNPTLVCLNTWDISRLAEDSKTLPTRAMTQAGIDLTQWLPISDAEAFSRVTSFLGASRTGYHMQGSRSTSLSDLMQGPSILIGIFGNTWTQRVSEPLRFHFVRDPEEEVVYIADRKDPSKRYDVMDAGGAGARDYAVIGRVLNPATGQVSFIVAGLNAAGTTAASEFVTSPRYMDYLESVVPNVSSAKNIEAVISIQVIDGRPGAPHVEAADSW
jgi:hypothetical protein